MERWSGRVHAFTFVSLCVGLFPRLLRIFSRWSFDRATQKRSRPDVSPVKIFECPSWLVLPRAPLRPFSTFSLTRFSTYHRLNPLYFPVLTPFPCLHVLSLAAVRCLFCDSLSSWISSAALFCSVSAACDFIRTILHFYYCCGFIFILWVTPVLHPFLLDASFFFYVCTLSTVCYVSRVFGRLMLISILIWLVLVVNNYVMMSVLIQKSIINCNFFSTRHFYFFSWTTVSLTFCAVTIELLFLRSFLSWKVTS